MRVGIITQPLYANYGGILQNYALQQVLIKMGHEPVTLDYMPSLSFGRYILYAGKGILCTLFPNKRHLIKPYKHFLERPEKINAFVRDNIILTKTIPDYSKRVLEKYGIEALIVGSDQVWRYSYNSHYIEDMYLAFAKDFQCSKIAYAASFGVEKWNYPDNKAVEVRELIKQFNAVSVREDSGVDICREGLGVDAVTALDPTLLLDMSFYERFCTAPSPSEPAYLAAYVLDMTEEKTEYIKKVADAKGLEVRMMTVSEAGISIEAWLSSIRNADYVITDSYHGTLFSIIFRKQFQTFINKKRGADRFNTLFGKINLQNQSTEAPIDYASVYTELEKLKEQSLSFISSALS